MPHRRPRKPGSFGGKLDELVEHFPDEETKPPRQPDNKPPGDSIDVHDRLFERAWRETRRKSQSSAFSNQ